MSRRLALVFAVLSVAVSTGAAPSTAAPAGRAGGKPPDVKAMMERNRKCMRELSAHAAKVSFDRKDLEKYLAEFRSFDELDIGKGPDDDSDDDKPGMDCVDLSAAAADPRYVAWARERRLDPKTWLLKSMRITLTNVKRRAPAQAAEMKERMDEQRRELEKRCGSMGPNACSEMRQAFASGDEAMRENAALWALFPEPSRAEAALLAEYDARLRKVTEDWGRRGGRHDDLDADADQDSPPEDDDQN